MAAEKYCVVGIRTRAGMLVKAFEVCIKEADIYVNYSDTSVASAHGSYHASGQQHIKIGRECVKWDGGPSRQMEPMKSERVPPKSVAGRELIWLIGWNVSKLESILPALDKADYVLDAQALAAESILAFEVSIVGQAALRHKTTAGFPILDVHVFGNAVRVEIAGFTLSESQWEPMQEKS